MNKDKKITLEIMAENLDTVENVKHMIHFHALACLDLSEKYPDSNLATATILKGELDRMSHALQGVSDILDTATSALYNFYYELDSRQDDDEGEGSSVVKGQGEAETP